MLIQAGFLFWGDGAFYTNFEFRCTAPGFLLRIPVHSGLPLRSVTLCLVICRPVLCLGVFGCCCIVVLIVH